MDYKRNSDSDGIVVERWDWYCELQFQRVAVTPLSGEAGAVTSTGQPAA